MADRRSGVMPVPAGPSAADLLAATPAAVILLDPADRIASVNAAGEQLLNLSERTMIGRRIDELLRLPQATAAHHDVAAYDCEVTTLHERRLRVDLAAGGVPDHAGWRVVTLHHRASARLGTERAPGGRAAIGAAAMLAHEIKNPLSGIRGAAQLISDGAPAAELTRLIIAEVDRVAGLIDRMEDFTDTRPLALSALNIYPLLSHACEVARAGFARAVTIETRFDPSLPAVLGHADALLQVLLNLLKNAAVAARETAHPRIVLATAFRHGMSVTAGERRIALPIEISVIDNGPGPTDDIADHLFEPFVSDRPEGKGLGLALVDKLARDMGGLAQYAREGQPAATVFRLLLPRAEA